MVKKEKYYLCPDCNDLVIETQILEEIGNGGLGMCYCKFNQGRILVPYKRISKNKFEILKTKQKMESFKRAKILL